MPRKKESSDEYEPEGLGGHNSSGSGKNLKNDSRQFLVKNKKTTVKNYVDRNFLKIFFGFRRSTHQGALTNHWS